MLPSTGEPVALTKIVSNVYVAAPRRWKPHATNAGDEHARIRAS